MKLARTPLAAALLLLLGPGCQEVAPADAPPLPDGTFPAAGGSGGCDGDGDGADAVACGGLDCDDTRREVRPGAEESCGNEIDDDCDGLVDEGCGCGVGDLESCWEHEAGKRGVGSCADGVRRCGADGVWGACTFAVAPSAEASGCDGVDSDCDGVADPDPACGACPADAEEICGNGLDDDCDGTIDPADICTVSCDEVNPRGEDPGDLGCCLRQPPATHEFECHESEGLAACTERECLDLDGDLETRCSKLCDGAGCFCGRRQAGGNLVPVADCGFLTPCARMDCAHRQNQPCYSGPPATLGVGICHAGTHSCVERAWTTCEGEQAPVPELCGNDLDDDCDGRIDEEEGSTGRRCAIGAGCADGAVEICGNGTDDDCDGFADEGCATTLGKQACWTGPVESRGIGACGDGTQTSTGGFFGPCEGQKLPAAEACGDGLDSDCDGLGGPGQQEEPSCCAPEPEVCNGLDDDCDGLADEELLDRCGQCPGTGSCYGVTFADLGDCSAPGRTCVGVESSRLDPGLVTLAPGDAAPGGGEGLVFYGAKVIPDPYHAELFQIDAATGQTTWTHDMGSNFVSDIVTSPDGTLWVAHTATLDHFTAAGELLCTTERFEYHVDMVADSGGDLWLHWGRFPTFQVRRISGTETIPQGEGVPRCQVLDLDPDGAGTDISIDNSSEIVHDAEGRLWVLSQRPVVVEDDGTRVTRLTDSGAFYFSAPALLPDGRIAVGWPLRVIDPEAMLANEPDAMKEIGSYGFATRMARPLPDGTLAVTFNDFSTPFQILHIDPVSGEELARHEVPAIASGFPSEAIVVDAYGMVWTGQGTELHRLDMATGEWETFLPGGRSLTFYHGSVSRGASGGSTRRKGSWSQVFDAGAWNVVWGTLSWEALAGSGNRVSVSARFSDDLASLPESTLVCGPYTASPADISACSQGRRYVRVEIELSGTGQPVAGPVSLTWDLPM